MNRDVLDHYTRLAPDYGRGANRACERAYRALTGTWFADAGAVLELGAGGACMVDSLAAKTRVACDLTPAMLYMAQCRTDTQRVAGDAEHLPFPDATFDAVFSINLAEHVPSPGTLFAETARVLKPGGRCLAITPNGAMEGLLNLLERFHLKLPEGPHHFLTQQHLIEAALPHLQLVESRQFLAFPAGPGWLVNGVDRVLAGRGLFIYAVFSR